MLRELGFSAGITRVRVEADSFHAWRHRWARPSITLPTSRHNEHRRSLLPRKLQRRGEAISWTGEHYDRIYAGWHSLSGSENGNVEVDGRS